MIGKKIVVMVILVGFVAGWSFAQAGLALPQADSEAAPPEAAPEETVPEKPAPPAKPVSTIPKNVITVDIMPTIYTGFYSVWGRILAIAESPFEFTSFGIGAQYERQLMEKLSITGRFAYLGFGAGLSDKEVDLGMKLFSFSTEAHVRYYFIDVLYLDGMMGYANLTAAFSGTADVTNDLGVKTGTKPVNYSATRSYMKLGALIGARVVPKLKPGKKVGFAFETSMGYYYGGIGFGDTLGQRLSNEVGEDIDVDPLFTLLERLIFIGGPRWTLGLGLAF